MWYNWLQMKNNKAIDMVRLAILKIPRGKLFSLKDFRLLATHTNIKQILSRLEKSNEITRVSRGIYVRDVLSNFEGYSYAPSLTKIIEKIVKETGETIVPHGAQALRALRLSQQVPLKMIFYTTGKSRILTLDKHKVHLKHISPSKMVIANEKIGYVVSALLYLGKENVTFEILDQIKNETEHFEELYNFLSEYPAWLSDILFRYKREKG